MRRFAKVFASVALTVTTAMGALVAPAQANPLGNLPTGSTAGMNPLGTGGNGILAANSSACAPNIVVNIPGGANSYGFLPENYPHGANVKDVGKNLRAANPGRVIDRYASYNSIPGGIHSYNQTRQNGYNRAWNILARDAVHCPNAKFSLVGYSMGADIASRITQAISADRGPISADRLSSAVFIANPNRGVAGVAQAGNAPRHTKGAFGGLPGGYGKLAGRVLDICRKGDVVCDTPDSASHLSTAVAKVAVLAGNVNVGEIADAVNAMTVRQRFTALPEFINGSIIHTNYYAIGGPAIAQSYIQARLA